jgi:trimeric autotransporter adhesin
MKCPLAAALLLLVSIPPRTVLGQVPRTLSYQGILSDTSGVPKSDGNYGMTFRLYNISLGGTPLWSETQVLATQRGLFNAVLGDITPFPDSLRFDRRYWLGLQVSPDPELTPRIQLTAVGYSLKARNADTAQYARSAPGSSIADSARIAGTVPNSSITSGNIASGQVVKSVNGVRDAVTLRGEGAASITSNGDTITITTPPPSGGTGIQGLQNTDNTLSIINPTGPTATVNVRVPLSLNGSWNGEQGALQILGDKPTIRFSGGAISGSESWIMHLGSDGPGNLGFFRRSGTGLWSNAMTLATNGNVGIGTAGPRTPLEVNGKILVTSQDALEGVGYQPYITLTDANSGYLQSRIQGANGDFIFYPSGGAAMVMKSGSGNVGIGTINPSARLDVVGSSGTGISGKSVSSHAVVGQSVSGIGVVGTSTGNNGVFGNSANGDGVRGETGSSNGSGVVGTTTSGAWGALGRQVGTAHAGVYAVSGPNGNINAAIWGVQNATAGAAGFFEGTVDVNGDLYATDKHFRIDHPLDPLNRYLEHASVESNERMNIYNGNITTDAHGEATVQLPNWFEALNVDFRYQLTTLGEEFAQARVSRKIERNRFSIKTDRPHIEVSWQVTGVRNDAYARTHPIRVEVDKPAEERGKYTFPELYGLPPRMKVLQPESLLDQRHKEKE